MFRSRFLATLLAASFAVQLLLAGEGSTCVRTRAVVSNGADVSMAGMDMSNDRRDATDAPAPSNDRTHQDDAPCGGTASSPACLVLSACASGFVSVASTDAVRERGLSIAVPASNVDTPASRSVAPELPPPRA
jgi:hypothetical protein